MNIVEYIGFAACLCATLAPLPQAIKLFRTKSAKSISFSAYTISIIGAILWLIYGYIIDSYPLIISNIITACFSISILVMKIKWKKTL